jgi:hypothetical protein
MGLSPKEKRILHLINRAQKWYDVRLTKDFRLEIVSKLQNGEYEKKYDSYWGRVVCVVTCRGIAMFVVIDRVQRPITILPPPALIPQQKRKKPRYVNQRRF